MIITADQRLAEKRGAKALIIGPFGVGKTSLLRTLNVTETLFVDIEAGDLSVQDVPVDTVRIDDWASARNLACRVGGPNPSFAPTACYSEAHYHSVGGALENLDRYEIVDFGDGKPIRAFVCNSPNKWGYPAKDRSGKLDQIEQPHLGKLISKLIPVVGGPDKTTQGNGG